MAVVGGICPSYRRWFPFTLTGVETRGPAPRARNGMAFASSWSVTVNTLRVLADRPEAPAQFLILGSASPDIVHSINVVSDELCRQVKRHRDKRRNRREARGAAAAALNGPIPVLDAEVLLEGGEVVLEAQVEPLPPDVSSAA